MPEVRHHDADTCAVTDTQVSSACLQPMGLYYGPTPNKGEELFKALLDAMDALVKEIRTNCGTPEGDHDDLEDLILQQVAAHYGIK